MTSMDLLPLLYLCNLFFLVEQKLSDRGRSSSMVTVIGIFPFRFLIEISR